MTGTDLSSMLFQGLIRLLVLFTAVHIHECAHALAADKLGDPSPRNRGRITLNPFAHLTLWGTLMMLLIGFGYGRPVEVNPSNFKHPKRDMALTALAGPASNLIMAYVSMIVYRLCYAYMEVNDTLIYLTIVFQYITIINISLAMFNFLPVPPLDGSKIFNAVLPDKLYFKVMQYERYIIIVVIVLVYSGLLTGPLSFLHYHALRIMLALTDWVDLLIK
ncbi:MAG: site-2 protease family protein [Oscillospiraceae bacterium]|nr:site-2 protease family protein [Oscillospiraceae bacterium]